MPLLHIRLGKHNTKGSPFVDRADQNKDENKLERSEIDLLAKIDLIGICTPDLDSIDFSYNHFLHWLGLCNAFQISPRKMC